LEIGLGLIHGFSTTKITKGHEKEEDLSRPLLVIVRAFSGLPGLGTWLTVVPQALEKCAPIPRTVGGGWRSMRSPTPPTVVPIPTATVASSVCL